MENTASTARRSIRIASQPQRILILQTAFIGDVVLVEPLIAKTKALFPSASIDVVVIPAAANLLETHPAIRDVIIYDKRGQQRGISGFLRMRKRLKDAHYDLAIVPHRSLRSAALVFLAKIPQRIGFETSAGSLLFNKTVHYSKTSHEVVRNLILLESFGTKVDYQTPELHPNTTDRETAWQIYRDISLPAIGQKHSEVIAIAPGSVWATKKWPAASFAELGKRLHQKYGCAIMLLGSDSDHIECEKIAASIGKTAYNLAGKLSLRQSAALLENCALLISNDSAPTHLGVAANCPVATIFGATIPGFGFYPHGPMHKAIETRKNLSCRPCGIHGGNTCPIGTLECMHSISVDQVFTEVASMIAPNKSAPLQISMQNGITKADMQRAIELLKNDGVLIIPTETLYGLAANILSKTAVARIFAIKFRSLASPLPLIAGSAEQVKTFCVLDGFAQAIADAFWPGPLTLVLPAKDNLPEHIVAQDGTVAVRVPASSFCRELANSLGTPITATSANLSGDPPVRDLNFLPPSLSIGVDMIFDNGKCENQHPSTIVKVAHGTLEILREGVITSEEIHARIGVPSIEQR